MCRELISLPTAADIVTGKPAQELRYHKEIVRDLSWHPYLPMMVTSAFDGSVVQWDPASLWTRSSAGASAPSAEGSCQSPAKTGWKTSTERRLRLRRCWRWQRFACTL